MIQFHRKKILLLENSRNCIRRSSEEADSIEEHRFIDIGTLDKNRVSVVVYTERENRARIISVRKSTNAERKMYE